MTTGPAPTLLGEIVTFSLVITPVSCNGTAGRGLFAKSFPLPQPVSARATVATLTETRNALLPRSGGLLRTRQYNVFGARILHRTLRPAVRRPPLRSPP